MNIAENELTMLATEVELSENIDGLHTRLAESRRIRRAVDRPSASLRAAEEAVDTAQCKVERLTAEKTRADALLVEIGDTLDAGDESIGVEDLLTAKLAAERLALLLKPASKDCRQAERVLAPLKSDEHLAELLAVALDQVTGAPVLACKTPAEAPVFEPLVIVSQLADTVGYGQLGASGSVQVIDNGADLNWSALAQVLYDDGSDAHVSPSGKVTFKSANWPVPRLTEPSVHALSELMGDIELAFGGQVAGVGEVQRMVDAGYNPGSMKTPWSGLFQRGSEVLEVAPGEAIGTASFVAAIQHDRGDSGSVDEIGADLYKVVDMFRTEAVGASTEAGLIESIDLDVEEYRLPANPWTRAEVPHIRGVTARPVTAAGTLRVVYRYEQV